MMQSHKRSFETVCVSIASRGLNWQYAVCRAATLLATTCGVIAYWLEVQQTNFSYPIALNHE